MAFNAVELKSNHEVRVGKAVAKNIVNREAPIVNKKNLRASLRSPCLAVKFSKAAKRPSMSPGMLPGQVMW